jgi:hypothetical protein
MRGAQKPSHEEMVSRMIEAQKGERSNVGEKKITKDPKKSLSAKNRVKYTMADVEPGENRRMLEHALEVMDLPEIDTYDYQQVRRRTAEYFAICAKNDVRPNMAGLALALKMSRQQLQVIRARKTKRPESVVGVLDQASALLNMQMEDYMNHNKINAIAGIFLMRNNYGYTNADTPQDTSRDFMAEHKTAEQIAEKYADIPDDE